MSTQDDLDKGGAELLDEDTTSKIEMVNGKPRISDQATLDQMEREEAARRLEEACQIFLTREREFQRIAEHPRVVSDPQMNCLWWDRLDAMYVAEKAVWKLFVGSQPTLAENRLYAKFRKLLLEGSKLKATG
jgi:hypothetical protein